jgi:predicted O-methyltransferase YrrM
MNYQTDKIAHGLIAEYEKLFADYKNKPLKILEIGVYTGGSLKWLVDFFPNATVVGGDILLRDAEGIKKYNSRIDSIWQLDQSIPASFAEMIKKCGPFDIVIDDGHHSHILTKNTFETLWKEVNSGGIYIIEDFLPGYSRYRQYRGMPNFITYIMLGKNWLGIGDYGVIVKEPKCSYAYFKKR